ncbi:hypothetical protein [Fusobacterium sp. PH5-44]|uniref:hypothetical protein n=1 Tax=unclassified Fusobacterium TaxID=2648384 RepID=UPI003D1ED854
MIDFLKTTTLVPQIGKGIYQGLKDDKKGILGQLNLNMGINGGKIVAFAKNTKGKIKDILKDAELIDGELYLNLNNTYEINELLKEVLAEQGKSFYDINYVIGENPNNLMAVDDSNGVININLIGLGFGNANNFLTGILHEGGHGTYADEKFDELAVRAAIGSYVSGKNKNIVLSEDLGAKVLNDTVQYYASRADGKLRDIVIGIGWNVSGAFIGRVNFGSTRYYIIDPKTGKGYIFSSIDLGIGLGAISAGGGGVVSIFPNVTNPNQLTMDSRGIGLSYGNVGLEAVRDGDQTILGTGFSGVKISGGPSIGYLSTPDPHFSFENTIERKIISWEPNETLIDISRKLEELTISKENTKKNKDKILNLIEQFDRELKKSNIK